MSLITQNRNFRRVFGASAVSNLGDGISVLAFPWLASLITRDATLIALVAAATKLPWLLFAVPAGVITDQFDRRVLIVTSDVVRCVLTVGVIALILAAPDLPLDDASQAALPLIGALSGAAFLLGCAEVLRDNAAQTLLPSIVDARDLEQANGQLWSVEQTMGRFIGPPLAGVLIAYAVPAPFVIDALTFAIAAWCVAQISLPVQATSSAPGFWSSMRDGICWMWQHKLVLQLALMLGLLNFTSALAETLLVLFSQDILDLSAAGYGILLTAGAAGGVLGGLLAPRIVSRIGGQATVFAALILFPAHFLAMATTSNVYVMAVALFVGWFAGLMWNVVTVSWRQRVIPDALLGRVNSIYRFFGWGTIPLGALAGGLMVSGLETEWGREAALRAPFYLAGLLSLGLLVYGTFRLRLS